MMFAHKLCMPALCRVLGPRSRVIVLSLLVLSGAACLGEPPPQAVAGVLDLRQQVLEDNLFALDGEWTFVPGQFLSPKQALPPGPFGEPLPSARPGALIRVPKVWNGQQVGGRVLPGTGYGTYRLRLLLPVTRPHELALHMLEIGTAYRLYANGRLVHASGAPASTRDRSRPDYRTGVFAFAGDASTVELMVHVSNHENKWGGIWHSIRMGPEPVVRRFRERALLAELSMFGILFALGVYHFILFAFRPNVRAPLYFGLFCVSVGLRTLLTGERALIGALFTYDWEWSYRFEYLSFYLTLPAWLAYVRSLYPLLASPWIIRSLLALTVPFVVMVFATPVMFYADYLVYFQLLTLITGLYTTYVSARAVRAGEVGSVTFLVGWVVLFAAVTVDIVAAQGVIRTVNFVPACFVFFVLAQSTIIAQRFAVAFATAENLTHEMDRRVRERTAELARARDEAERSNRAKSEFLSVVSHELRTPMHGILGVADLLTESPMSEEQAGYVRLLKRSGTRMMKLIGEILDMARIEAGRVELQPATFVLREAVEQSLLALGVRARAKGIALSVDFQPDVPARVVGDSARLEQVLLNLVGNALKFAEQGSVSVRVACESRKEEDVELLFSVSDTGPGIPEHLRDQLFKPFSQGDSSSTRRHGGTGLGLAISRGIVELMGGKIDFTNRPEGGTVFHFTVVLRDAPDSADASEANSQTARDGSAGPVDLRGMRLLIAEDDEDNVRLIRHYLRGTGVEATVVANGRRAVEESQVGRFDVLLLDIQMPVLDGLEAVRAIRERERVMGVEPVPILALSAGARANDEERSIAAGFDAHLSKPVSRAGLLFALAETRRPPARG